MTKPSVLRGTAALAVLFGLQFAAALNAAAELVGADIAWPSLPVPVNVSATSLTVAGVWLLVRARRSPRGCAAWCAAGLAVVGIVLLPYPSEAARTAATLLLTAAGAWLCAQVAADAGVPLWQGRSPHQIVRRCDKKALAACAVVVAGHAQAGAAEYWLKKLGPAVADRAEQTSALSLHDPVMIAAQALAAGAREEIPLLVLPAALMAAARRPVWQILLVVCVLRIASHAYVGTPALATAVFAAAALWMYKATGRIGPLIAGHMLFNAVVLFGQVGALVLMASPVVAWFLLPEVLDEASPGWLRRIFPDKRAASGRTDNAGEAPAGTTSVSTGSDAR